MRKPLAAITAAAFFALAPGFVAGVLPWYLSDGWKRNDQRGAWLLVGPGAGLIVAGTATLVSAFIRYVTEGLGTPSPAAPTERLVVGGLNRYVRNPMYLAVVDVIFGQALVLAQPVLLVYGAVAFATMAAFARWYEEPALTRRFGSHYHAYCQQVPRWLPRRTGRNRSHT